MFTRFISARSRNAMRSISLRIALAHMRNNEIHSARDDSAFYVSALAQNNTIHNVIKMFTRFMSARSRNAMRPISLRIALSLTLICEIMKVTVRMMISRLMSRVRAMQFD